MKFVKTIFTAHFTVRDILQECFGLKKICLCGGKTFNIKRTAYISMACVPVCISYNTGKAQVPGCAITNMFNLWHS